MLQLFINQQSSYEVPHTSFVKTGYNNITDEHICWIKVIGQTSPAIDYWIMGGSFLSHYYITFNADDKDQPKIGITPPNANAMRDVEMAAEPEKPVTNPSLDADSWTSSSYEVPGRSGAATIAAAFGSVLALTALV